MPQANSAETEPHRNRRALDRLARQAVHLGYEIVEISGTLDEIDTGTQAQMDALSDLRRDAGTLLEANRLVEQTAAHVKGRFEDTESSIDTLVDHLTKSTSATARLSTWVSKLDSRVAQISELVQDVRKSNDLITAIAKQINILAINAKIESARAGEAGRSFAVVAEEVNGLSRKTSVAAGSISDQVAELEDWITELSVETKEYADLAGNVQMGTKETDGVLSNVQLRATETHSDAEDIIEKAVAVRQAGVGFAPTFSRIDESAQDSACRIMQTRDRLHQLVNISEEMVQGTVAAGGTADDARFIQRVCQDANALSGLLEEALRSGKISESALFSREYKAIQNTDPEQVMAPFTLLTDELFPKVQEEALIFDEKVVFCAAVDTNGYLPTHNRKFSQPTCDDPVWNAANCRNRRIFDDRVGLKAGRNTRSFLLQVYRRDMGGGKFKMMKDLSAPIQVRGRHWGGLRLAYNF